jgi:ribosome-associated toxin RatA of RatAB toxin-antitoxin module
VEIKRAVLVPFAAEAMFDLIEQAEHYPEFLPWCVGSTILERSDEWVAARIDFRYLGVRFGFQTRNAKRRPASMQVGLVEGPFRRFQVEWKLTPLGNIGCKVSFEMGYEIADSLLDKVAAKGVEMVSRSMLDAFVKRAEQTLTPITAATPPEPAIPEVPLAVAPPPMPVVEPAPTAVIETQPLAVAPVEPTAPIRPNLPNPVIPRNPT